MARAVFLADFVVFAVKDSFASVQAWLWFVKSSGKDFP
jgi:hypothetical protein